MSDSFWPHRLQQARLPCPSPSPRGCSNSCPSNHLVLCHPLLLPLIFPRVRVLSKLHSAQKAFSKKTSFSPGYVPSFFSPLLIIFFFGICILRGGSPTPSLDHSACVPQPVLSSASGSLHCSVLSPCRPEGESKVFLVSQTTYLHLLGRHCESCILLFPILRWPLEASELNLMFLKKLNIELPYDPAIPFLGMNFQKNGKQGLRYLYTHVHSITILNSQEVGAIQVLTDRWMGKQNVVYTCIGILALKRKGILIHVATWMTCEDTTLSEISHSQ